MWVAQNVTVEAGQRINTQVKAKLMVVAATQDHMVNPTPALEFARILQATIVELTGDCGHLEPGCDKAVAAPKVREFLGN